MAKRNIALLLAMVLLLVPRGGSAHPGRTDAEGGHYDRSTGEYHYHHGYPAHQHRDLDGDGVADCPYTWEKQTDRHSDLSEVGSVTVSMQETEQAETVAALEEALEQAEDRYILAQAALAEKEKRSNGKTAVLAAIILGTAGLYLWTEYRRRGMKAEKESVYQSYSAERKRADDIQRQLEAARQETEQTKGVLKAAKQETAQVKELLEEVLRQKETAEKEREAMRSGTVHQAMEKYCFSQLVGAPVGTRINGNKEAVDENGSDARYSVWLSDSGVVHHPGCTYAYAGRRVNLMQLQGKHYKRCRRCEMILPEDRWMQRYTALYELNERLNLGIYNDLGGEESERPETRAEQ